MIFSLLVAFVITPWAALRFLRGAKAGHHEGESEDRTTRLYRWFMGKLLSRSKNRWMFLSLVVKLRLSLGESLQQAVVDAGAVRFRPMLLTAAAVVVGSAVILFDPIFQGLAISLMAGEVASLLLSRMTVPVLFYMMRRREPQHHPVLPKPVELS
jgi:multidrug efflux pump subunit AcrB